METIKVVTCRKRGPWKNRRARYNRDLVSRDQLPAFGKQYDVISEGRMYVGRSSNGQDMFASYYILAGFPGCVAFAQDQFKDYTNGI